MRFTQRREGAKGLAAFGLLLVGAQSPKTLIQVWEKPLAPGLIYRMEFDPNAPRTLNAIRISPQSPSLHWNTELAGTTVNEDGTLKGRLTPTEIAAQTGALVAVNGDFFSYDHGAPIGQMVRNGELITTAVVPRAVFAWGATDSAVGPANAKATIRFGSGQTLDLDGVNQPVGTNGMALYTSAVGTMLNAKPNLTAVLQMPNEPLTPNSNLTATFDYAMPDAQKVPVPAGRALLVATGDNMARLAALRKGSKISIRVKTDGFDWSRFDNAVGGGPFLLRDGKPAIDAEAEGFAASFRVRHPRTAIGRTADGDVWIATVDGRQGSSVGATLEEMAAAMQRLGCVDAINLDGGGSTALNVAGLTVNRPSDGVERQVSNALLVFGPAPEKKPGKLTLSLRSNVVIYGTVQAAVSLDGNPVPNTDVLWSSRGAGWIDQGGLLHGIHAGTAKVMARVYGQTVQGSVSVKGPAPTDPKQIQPADKG